MSIYLTDYRTTWSDKTKFIADARFPQTVHLFEDCFTRLSTGLTYVPHKIAEKVLDPLLCKSLREIPCKTAFIFASGNSHLAGFNSRTYDNSLSYNYKIMPFTLTQVYAGRVAQSFGVCDQITTDASACASSLKAMMTVRELIELYKFDRVVVLAVEDSVSNSTLDFFGEAQAYISEKQEKEGLLPSAFDSKNYGFRVGQGAALAIFESERQAAKSKSDPKARLLGAYTASEESTNAIGQRNDGQGFVKAAQGAMEFSNISSKEINVIKTHGTGTQSNNVSEKAALGTIFSTPFIATSFKPRIGHTMGASGLLETLLLLDSMGNGVVPEIFNRTESDEVYISKPAQVDKNSIILSLAAGMGNIYSAAIFDMRV